MSFYIGRVKVSAEFGFFALTALFLIIDRGGIGLEVLGAVILHEVGHVLLLYISGGQVRELKLRFCGAALEPEGMLSYRQEIMLVSGGIVGNGLGTLLSMVFGKRGTPFFWGNLVLMCFHMLPVYPLDGGRLLRLMVGGGEREGAGELAGLAVGIAVLIPMLTLGVRMMEKNNPTLFITGLYLGVSMILEKNKKI